MQDRFSAKSWLNDLEDVGQSQRSLCMTHPLMPVIICTKHGKKQSRTVGATERTRQNVPYFSRFHAKSWLDDLEDVGQSQRSLHLTHPLMPVIICSKYGKNPSRTVGATELKRQNVPYFSMFHAKSWLNELEDVGQGQRS